MRGLIRQGCGGQCLTRFGEQAFGFIHFARIGLVRSAC
jgi:hypothetical protein